MSAAVHAEAVEGRRPRIERILVAVLILVLGGLALTTPLIAGKNSAVLLGILIVASSLLETTQAFAQSDPRAGRSIFLSSTVSFVAGLLLLAQPRLILDALALLLGLSFALDGLFHVGTAILLRRQTGWALALGQGVLDLALGALIACQWPLAGAWSLAVYVGLRILAIGWSLLLSRSAGQFPSAEEAAAQHPDARLHLPAAEEVAFLQSRVIAQEEARRSIDRYWLGVFLLTFFAIHVGRMDADWTMVGLLSPGVAVIGDIVFALMIGYGVIMPASLLQRALTRPLERRVWKWLGPEPVEERVAISRRMLQRWLMWRISFSRRVNQARRSPRAAFGWGLEVGLPVTAILVAMNPIWGFSWYFNTENWATEIWNNWAEQRTDTWRAEMTKAVTAAYQGSDLSGKQLFEVAPPGASGASDFSFLVIGDPGEGDASQHILRDQFLLLGQQPEVKFLVISSDVIYPSGAMKDYESRFYLPFKGFAKPIYAIPGNHDWYDALEAFAANFLEAPAARSAMRARRTVDHGLTTTTESRIETAIQQAARLREQYGLQVGTQRAPYFEIHTDRLSLISVDTGVLRTVDADQLAWLQTALTRARGRFKFVVLGHPLYAGGAYQGATDEPFAALHRLLRENEVDVVMAGDTHDFEFYRESYTSGNKQRTLHHFVNGGGGAYLSIGTALDWPAEPPVPECGIYPRRDAIVNKLDQETPLWKQPLWFWVKRFHAWPSSAESFASAFDFNRAPFFQSFVKVQVDGPANVVRIWPYGAGGRLRWRDFEIHGSTVQQGGTNHDLVEFLMPLPPKP